MKSSLTILAFSLATALGIHAVNAQYNIYGNQSDSYGGSTPYANPPTDYHYGAPSTAYDYGYRPSAPPPQYAPNYSSPPSLPCVAALGRC